MTHHNFDAVREFADAIYQDLGSEIEPVADGEMHRFDCPEGRRGNRACWYVLHSYGVPAGAYGSWKTGTQFTWRRRISRPVTEEERKGTQAMMRVAIRKREQMRQDVQARAAISAETLWLTSKPAAKNHPYLIRKRIPALGLRQQGHCLLVPLRTTTGKLVNVQRIFPDDRKRFLKGGRVAGAFCLLGAREIPANGTLYLAEGVATALTIYVETNAPVVASMNAGNLMPVAQAIRQDHPDLEMVIAADNDHRTPGNPGMSKGIEAARAVGCGLVWPRVCGGEQCSCSDFNDLANCCREVSRA